MTFPTQVAMPATTQMSNPTMAILVNSAPIQSVAELSQLIKANKSRLSWFVRKHLRNDEFVEDLFQQTCLEAFRNWGNFRGESKPETWLFGIALNLVRNYKSRDVNYRFSFESLDEEDSVELESVSEEEPMQHLLRAERIQKIKEAINALPLKMQNVVQLVILDGYSYQDAALELDLPIGTIRSRVSRARDLLVELLQD
ncbi:MAG: sigma-70 family RNA polymerase sigma factor [Limnobacter sp.]|nr:sigma-70 family RNA polymerase sigma factor [Limnobacter sp.]